MQDMPNGGQSSVRLLLAGGRQFASTVRMLLQTCIWNMYSQTMEHVCTAKCSDDAITAATPHIVFTCAEKDLLEMMQLPSCSPLDMLPCISAGSMGGNAMAVFGPDDDMPLPDILFEDDDDDDLL